MEIKGVFHFEIIINVLVRSFWLIWVPVLYVYNHFKYFDSYSVGIFFSRQNLTSTDVRFWRLKSILALYGLINNCDADIMSRDFGLYNTQYTVYMIDKYPQYIAWY